LKNVEDKQTKEMEKLINEIFLTECVWTTFIKKQQKNWSNVFHKLCFEILFLNLVQCRMTHQLIFKWCPIFKEILALFQLIEFENENHLPKTMFHHYLLLLYEENSHSLQTRFIILSCKTNSLERDTSWFWKIEGHEIGLRIRNHFHEFFNLLLVQLIWEYSILFSE
jgi:hypothetical protein